MVRLFAPLSCLYSRQLAGDYFKKRMRKVSPSWRHFLFAAANGSAKSLCFLVRRRSCTGFMSCIISADHRNMYLLHTLRRWAFGSRCRRLFFVSQRLASRAFVRTNAERRRAVRTALRRLSCFKGTPPNPRSALTQIKYERNDAYRKQETANQNRGSTDRETKKTNRSRRKKVRHNCK